MVTTFIFYPDTFMHSLKLPFVDGNQRPAFQVTGLFLRVNGDRLP